jgi:hypothetical protein
MRSALDDVTLSITCFLIESTGMHPKFAAKRAVELAAKDGYVVDAKKIEAEISAELRRRRRLGFGVTHWAYHGRGQPSRDPACGVKPAAGACSTSQRHVVSCKRCLSCVRKWEREKKGK